MNYLDCPLACVVVIGDIDVVVVVPDVDRRGWMGVSYRAQASNILDLYLVRTNARDVHHPVLLTVVVVVHRYCPLGCAKTGAGGQYRRSSIGFIRSGMRRLKNPH